MEEHRGAGKGGGGVLSWDESKREGIVLVLQTRPSTVSFQYHTQGGIYCSFSLLFSGSDRKAQDFWTCKTNS